MGAREDFVRRYYPVAKRYEAQTGIPASVFLGMGASETNWGAAGSLFGIKGKSPSGKSKTYATWEQVNGQRVNTSDEFAVYDTEEEGFDHFLGLISSGRYKPAWDAFQQTGDWRALIRGINQAGYATDPKWYQNIESLAGQVDTLAKQTGADALPTAPAGAATPSGQTQDPAKADAFATVVALGQKEIGKRYAGPIVGEADAARWGSPGWDCSSFVSGVYKQLGIKLTPYTDAAYGETKAIDQNAAKPGDIIFYRGGSEAQPNIAYHHMGIYMGEGKVLSAQYGSGVQIHDIAAADITKQGWEIRRAPGIEAAQVPAAAQQAVTTGQRLAEGGPSGGSAVTAPQSPGGAAVPAAQATSPFAQIAKDAHADYQQAQAQLTTLTTQIEAAQRRVEAATAAGKAPNGTDLDFLDAAVKERQSYLTARNAAMDNWVAAEAQAAKEKDTGPEPVSPVDIQRLRNEALTIAQTGAHNTFVDQQAAQGAVMEVIKYNHDALDKWVDTQIRAGTLNLEGAVNVYSAQLQQQASNLDRASKVLSAAGFIEETRRKNLSTFLPAGQTEQPSFGENGPMAQVMRSIGLPPTILRALPVDTDTLDPLRILGEADTSAGIPGTFAGNVKGVEDAAARNRQIDIGTKPAPVTIGGKDPGTNIDLAAAPTLADYEARYRDVIAGGILDPAVAQREQAARAAAAEAATRTAVLPGASAATIATPAPYKRPNLWPGAAPGEVVNPRQAYAAPLPEQSAEETDSPSRVAQATPAAQAPVTALPAPPGQPATEYSWDESARRYIKKVAGQALRIPAAFSLSGR